MVIDPNEIMEMIFSLPEEKRDKLVANIIRKWDPDFVKLTPDEKRELDEAKAEMSEGEYILGEYMEKDDIFDVVDKIESDREKGLIKGTLAELLDKHYKK